MSPLSSKAFFVLILLASSFQNAYSIPVNKPNVNAIRAVNAQELRAAGPQMHTVSKYIDGFDELQPRVNSHSGHDSDSESGSSHSAEQQSHPAQQPTAHQPPAHQAPAQQPQSHSTAQRGRPQPRRAYTYALGNQAAHVTAPTASTSNANHHGGSSANIRTSGGQVVAPQQQQLATMGAGPSAHPGAYLAHPGPPGHDDMGLPPNLQQLMLPNPGPNFNVPPPGLFQGAPPVNGQYYQGVPVRTPVGYRHRLPAIHPGPYPPPNSMVAPQHNQPGQMGYVPAQPPMQVPHQPFVPDLGYWSAFGRPHQVEEGAAHPAPQRFNQGQQYPPNNNNGGSSSSQGHSGHSG